MAIAMKAASVAIRMGDYEGFMQNDARISVALDDIDRNIKDCITKVEVLNAKRTEIIGARDRLFKALENSPQASYFNRRKEADKNMAKPEVRAQVFSRDGFKCVRCQTPNNLTIDHILSVRLGGGDELGNLQTLCRSCNSSKGSGLNTQSMEVRAA